MRNYIKYTVILVFMLAFLNAEAQTIDESIGFGDSVNDTNSAPINFLIPLAIAVGVALGIQKLK